MSKIFLRTIIILIAILSILLILFFIVKLNYTRIKYYEDGLESYFIDDFNFNERELEIQLDRIKKEDPVANSYIAYYTFDIRFVSVLGCLGESIVGINDLDTEIIFSKVIWGSTPNNRNDVLERWSIKYALEYNKNLSKLLGYSDGFVQAYDRIEQIIQSLEE